MRRDLWECGQEKTPNFWFGRHRDISTPRGFQCPKREWLGGRWKIKAGCESLGWRVGMAVEWRRGERQGFVCCMLYKTNENLCTEHHIAIILLHKVRSLF